MEEDKLNKAIDLLKSEIDIYDQYYCLATSQALKIVLNELDRLQKENKALNKVINKQRKTRDELILNSIPKQVVRDKVEELEYAKSCSDKFYQFITEDKIKLLKELLGE